MGKRDMLWKHELIGECLMEAGFAVRLVDCTPCLLNMQVKCF